MNIPENILRWLHERGLTTKVIADNHLSWNGSAIVIPIFDPYGNFLFNKYRRDPFGDQTGPKYKYDAGATAQLFHANKFIDSKVVIAVEGEFDAMRLESEGYLAVSTTGGAGTWKNEWTELLQDKEVIIVYDNDEAGLKGAVKLLTKMPASIVFLPRIKDVKDVTDYLHRRSFLDFNLLLKAAKKYPELSEKPIEAETINAAKDNIRMFKSFLKDLQQKKVEDQNAGRATFQYEYLCRPLEDIIEDQQRIVARIHNNRSPVGEPVNGVSAADIARAKSVGMVSLFAGKLSPLQGHRRTGKCPFHKEDTASFTIYTNQNRFFCYGCSAGGDTIEFMMKLEGLTFQDAVKRLLRCR
jgi:DNA primase